jgi:hypothetical protein
MSPALSSQCDQAAGGGSEQEPVNELVSIEGGWEDVVIVIHIHYHHQPSSPRSVHLKGDGVGEVPCTRAEGDEVGGPHLPSVAALLLPPSSPSHTHHKVVVAVIHTEAE